MTHQKHHNRRGDLRRKPWGLPLWLLLLAVSAQAATFTVRPSGGNYTTIQACANAAVAGDICEVYAGSYSGWTQSANGAAGNPILFRARAGDSVTINGTINLSGRSYIAIQGFTTIAGSIIGNGSTHHNLIENNGFTQTYAFRINDGLGSGGSDNLIRNNIVDMNTYGGSSRAPAFYVYGDRNVFEGNEIYNGASDAFEIGGNNLVVRNNYFHDLNPTVSTEHVDFIQSIGGGTSPTIAFTLIEGNVVKNCTDPTGNCHFTIFRQCSGVGGCSLAGDTIIQRYNYVQNWDGSGSSYGGVGDNAPNGRFYNNTIATEALAPENGAGVSFQNAANGVVLNNIFHNTSANSWSPHVGTALANKNIAYNTGYTGTWNSYYSVEATYNALRNLNPLFANYPADASLQPTSPAINAGGPLTSVASGDSGSGTTLVVSDARFFQPGWAGVLGDWIAIGTTSNIAQITAINYSNNTLTLASSISRSSGQSVWLYMDSAGRQVLYGSAPDIGAYEFTGGSVGPRTYTVKSGGGGDFATIQACASAMAAGDTCVVYAGTYNENVTLSAGTSGNIKTIRANTGDAVYVYSFTLGSYTKLQGFQIQRPAAPSSTDCVSVSGSANHVEIDGNTLYACGSSAMISIPTTAADVHVHGNTLSYSGTTSGNAVSNEGRGINSLGNRVLIENNDFSHYQLGIVYGGSYSIFRNNTFHDQFETEAGSNHHTDSIFSEQSTPTQYNVIERNFQADAFGPNAKGMLSQDDVCNGQCFNVIIRFNTIARIGSGAITNDKTWPNVKVYNNTWVEPNKDAGTTFGGTNNSISAPGSAYLNDIYYYTNSSITDFNPYFCGSGCNYGHNLYYCTGTCTNFHSHTYGSGSFANDPGNLAATNPQFVNFASRDFRLQSGSPAIDAGTHLTTVASSDSGAGTSLIVNDASYFQYGYGLPGVQGDWIAVGSVGNVAQITAINYVNNTLTLASPLSRSAGQQIWLYKDSTGQQVFYGGAPDIGAYEYTGSAAPSAGSLQLSAASYSVGEAGGNASITVTRTGGSAGAVGISYATSNGTAQSGSDYTAVSGTLSWASGDAANKTFTVAITNDTAVESNETINLTLSNATGGATLGSPSTAVLTITDDDVATNQAPTVAAAAAATPSPVTGNTATLSALGADDGGEAALTYTWATTGTPPAAVTYTPAGRNGTNAAKSITANFTRAGSYTFQVTIRDAQGLTATSNVSVTVNQILTTITVSPAAASVGLNGTRSFSASAFDQFGQAMTSAPTFGWTVSGGGSINSSGLFTAGSTPGGPFTVTASASGRSGTAQVTVTNSAPTVATAASASPSPVTGNTTTLSVLGADDGGEAALTYTWATTGTPPAAVTYTPAGRNGTNAAKSITANFTRAGSYTFQVTIRDAQGLTVTSNVTVAVNQTLTTIQVNPPAASIQTSQTQDFNGTGLDQFGLAMTSQPTIAWTVSGGGSINSSGLFTAGSTPGGPFTVTASASGRSGTGQVTITSAPNNPPTIATPASASPNPVTGTTSNLSVLGADDAGESSLTYTWNVPAGVSFSLNGTNAAKNTTATFTQAGTYSMTVTVQDGQGQTVTSAVSVTVNATVTSIQISPPLSSVQINQTRIFSAVAFDQFGQVLASPPSFSWTVSGGGSINSSGLFTAGATPGGPFTVTASASGRSGTAQVSVTASPNNPPTVASAAQATPNPVTGVNAALGVLGADDGGETNLTYTWSTSGNPPALVNFSANGSNAAKNTLATFVRAGSYSLQVTIQEPGGLTATSSVNVTVQQTLSGLTVTPPIAVVAPGGTQAFTASQVDQFGQAMGSAQAVVWLVTGDSINSSGLFTAGPSGGGPYVVTANAGGQSATAFVLVTGGQTTPGALPEPFLDAYDGKTLTTQDQIMLQYNAAVTGFIWSVTPQGVSISAKGYQAPRAGAINAYATQAPQLNLGILGLEPGAYEIQVIAQNGSQNSTPGRARVTLVSADLAGVKVYPNPWRADRHTGDVSFSGLSANTTVKIFTVSGHLIRKLPAAAGQQTWDLKTDSGDRAASGIYLYVIEDGSNKRKGKLAVIR